MSSDTKSYVVGLLESYQKRAKQIELLHYELSHPSRVSENEMIGALSLAHGEGGGVHGCHTSDKTLYIALNYQDRVNYLNGENTSELVDQLVSLEQEQERLKYYVSLLDERQKKVIKLFYFEGKTQDEVAERMVVSVRYVRSIKAKAINELIFMYGYVKDLNQGDS